MNLQIAYDPAYLEVVGAIPAPGMPEGTVVELNSPVPGFAVVTLTGSGLPAGRNTVVELQARVPTTDADGILLKHHVLDVHGVAITDEDDQVIPAIDDDAVHLVSYFGDPSGNGRINATDASLVARVAASLDSGFSSSILVDPTIIGDISGNRRVNASDASLVARYAALYDVPEIPAIPSGVLGGASANSVIATTLTDRPRTPASARSLGDSKSSAAFAWPSDGLLDEQFRSASHRRNFTAREVLELEIIGTGDRGTTRAARQRSEQIPVVRDVPAVLVSADVLGGRLSRPVSIADGLEAPPDGVARDRSLAAGFERMDRTWPALPSDSRRAARFEELVDRVMGEEAEDDNECFELLADGWLADGEPSP